jgi:hypothetical protein
VPYFFSKVSDYGSFKVRYKGTRTHLTDRFARLRTRPNVLMHFFFELVISQCGFLDAQVRKCVQNSSFLGQELESGSPISVFNLKIIIVF